MQYLCLKARGHTLSLWPPQDIYSSINTAGLSNIGMRSVTVSPPSQQQQSMAQGNL
jgi:hypothetical protein